MTNGKLLKVSFLVLGMFSGAKMASADTVMQNKEATPHRPVATVLPENGKLTTDNGKLHQGIALECVGGKPGGISYYSPKNDLNVATDAPVNIEIRVDNNHPIKFTASRKRNERAPDALTVKSYDTDSTLSLIHDLEIAKNDVQVKVWTPEGDKSKTFELKASDMKGAINNFRSYCDGN